MDPTHIGLILVGGMVVLFFAGVPIAYSLGVCGLVGMTALYGWDTSIVFFARKLHSYLGAFHFTAVPLFVLMGFYALYSALTTDAFRAAQVWLARLPGGLASATVLASALFAACSGSGLPATAALGRLACPEMINAGYDRRLATGVVAASTPMAVLIPPSVIMIIFGILTETSIARLLIAGILPGVLSTIIFVGGITLLILARPHMAPRYTATITWGIRFTELRRVIGIVILFILVIGSIYLGWATPTEAAGLGAFGALVLGLAMRRLTLRDIARSCMDTVRLSGFMFILVGGAAVFIVFLTRSGLVAQLAEFLAGLEVSPVVMMFALSILYILLGMFIDSVSMMVITIPIVLPVLMAMEVDLIWFGILVVIWVEIAAITPPFGICVYVLKGAIGEMVELWEIFRGCFFFLGLWLLILVILIFFPQISTWLPYLMKG